MTVGQWLPDWLEGAKATIRPASYTRYHGIITNHMLKAPLAGIPLQKLTESHIEMYYASIPVGSRPLHHTVLRRALRKAKKQKYLANNPAGDLDHVPRRPKPQHDDARVNCWTAVEASSFLVVAKAAGPQTRPSTPRPWIRGPGRTSSVGCPGTTSTSRQVASASLGN
jgi:hypothetical protein